MKTNPLCVLVLLLTCPAGFGCVSARDASAEPDWPKTISYHRLELSDRDELARQSYALHTQALRERLGDPKQTRTREYRGIKGPTGHGGLFGTTVYYVVNHNQFYFHSDCGQGHNDGIIGPFEGDPRIVLALPPVQPNMGKVEDDPYVGLYTAFHLWGTQPGKTRHFMLEKNDYQFPLMICKQDGHYLINIEPNLRLVTAGDKGLVPERGTLGVTVRYIRRDLVLEGFDALRIQDQTFSTGFALVRGVGPAKFGSSDPEKHQSLAEDWSYQRQSIDAGRSRGGVIGKLIYKGEPIDPSAVHPGRIIITPTGKFIYFGEPPPDTDTYKYLSGWLDADHRGERFFNADGSLTATGLARRVELKRMK